jgi:hypothetical protein
MTPGVKIVTVPSVFSSTGSQPTFLDWHRDVRLASPGNKETPQGAGFAIGAALILALGAGSSAAIYLRTWGWVGWLLACVFASYAVIQWVLGRRAASGPAPGAGWTWPVRFGLHDLGAEAVIDAPPRDIAIQLLYQLRSQADPPPRVAFLAGLRRGVSFSWRAADAMDEPALGVEVRWEDVTAVRMDTGEMVIDLSARGGPGLRLYCTAENVTDVRQFVRRRVPLRFWDELDDPS